MAQADFTRIASNIGALNALYSLRKTNNLLGLHQTRLATGRRINSAEEDPAGLSIATKMLTRSESMKVALDNIGDAKNMLSVAEAGLQKINDILVQMRSKAQQAASDTLGSAERTAVQDQLDAWAEEINSIVETTKWNGQKLLDGLSEFTSNKVVFQVGADTDSANQVELNATNFGNVQTQYLGIGSTTRSVSSTADWTVTANNGTFDYDEVSLSTTATSETLAHTELATGSYTLHIVATASNDVAVQLLDGNGNVVQIDNGSGILASSRTGLDPSAADVTVDTGRGLVIVLETGTLVAADDFEITFTYSQVGTYNGDVSNADDALAAVNALDSAISTVSTRLSSVGALAGRLTFREEALGVAQVNTEAAYNRIMNADMAKEQVEATKLAILQQTSLAMLGQANLMPQNILSLFR